MHPDSKIRLHEEQNSPVQPTNSPTDWGLSFDSATTDTSSFISELLYSILAENQTFFQAVALLETESGGPPGIFSILKSLHKTWKQKRTFREYIPFASQQGLLPCAVSPPEALQTAASLGT